MAVHVISQWTPFVVPHSLPSIPPTWSMRFIKTVWMVTVDKLAVPMKGWWEIVGKREGKHKLWEFWDRRTNGISSAIQLRLKSRDISLVHNFCVSRSIDLNHGSLRILGSILEMQFQFWLVSSDLLPLMPMHECHGTWLHISQHWFR